MKVTCERLEDSQVLLHVEVEPERAAKSIDEAYRRLVSRVSIPGFRKGKAPRQVVERLIGNDALVQEGIDILLPQVFREAVAETGIEPIDQPHVDIVQEQPLVVNMTVPVRPTVELGEYHDIHVEREKVSVSEDEVDRVLEDLREQHAEWIPMERPAAAEDRVTIDVIGHVRGAPVLYNPEGQAILEAAEGEPVVDQKGVEYTIKPGTPLPAPGFSEELVGVGQGEEKRFEKTLPADYPDRELANKSIIFQVKVNAVKEKRLPELDDEFAKTVGDYDTLESLRKTVRENLQQRADRDAENRLTEQVLNMVTDRAQISLPAVLIEREIDRLVERAERQLRQARLSLNEYLQANRKSKDDLRAEYRVDAIANLRRFLVLEEIAQKENIEVSPDAVDAEIKKIGEVLGEAGAKATAALNEPDRREDLADDLRHRMVLERLVAIATGEAEKEEPAAGDVSGEASEAE